MNSTAKMAAPRLEHYLPMLTAGQVDALVLARMPLLDEYKLVSSLGRGAMGCVYRAHDTLLDRPVAIKFLTALGAVNRERFLIEARAIARLSHPNVVTIHRVGVVGNVPYLISEYIRGTSLDRLQLPLPWTDVLPIATGLCRGLAAAHRRGVLHRDIKPANSMRTEDGEVKLLDFGLAKLSGESVGNSLDALLPVTRAGTMPLADLKGSLALAQTASPVDPAPPLPNAPPQSDSPSALLTQTGAFMGTPLYMAPEMWRGEPATPQVDIYSLGALLYELLSGQPPHRADSLDSLGDIVENRDATPLRKAAPQVDAGLATIVDRCLRRDPRERYQSTDLLLTALEQLGERTEPAGAGTSPYRGLSAFEAEHRALFFGRRAEVRAVLDRLVREPMVLVAGDSGVGKSSLCRAGVLPRVLRGGLGRARLYTVVSLLPGPRPLQALSEALAAPLGETSTIVRDLIKDAPAELVRRLHSRRGRDQALLVFIDQLEELLTQAPADEAALFGTALGELAVDGPAVRVLMTARGDFLTRLAALPGLGDVLSRIVYILRPLRREGLHEAIVRPAELAGVRFESETLVEALADATLHTDGGLPLLQFALAELWDARDVKNGVITQAALTAMGGVSGALARHADRVLAALVPEQHRAAQRALLRLVSSQGLRHRVPVAELSDGKPATTQALEALVRGRLLTVGQLEEQPTYEIAHEALFEHWHELRHWIDEGQAERRFHERVTEAVRLWDEGGRAPGRLWRPPDLDLLRTFARRRSGDLSFSELAFLRASEKQLDAERRARQLSIGSAIALVVILIAGLAYGLSQQRQRIKEAALAKEELRQKLLDTYVESGRQLLVDKDDPIEGALWLSRAASEGSHHPVLGTLLAEALRTIDAQQRVLLGHKEPLTDAVFSADGKLLLTASQDQTARIWDAQSGQLLRELKGHTASVNSAAISNDGRLAATASSDDTVRIWDVASGRFLRDLKGHTWSVNRVSFSPDGRTLATASDDKSARLWDTDSGREVYRFPDHEGAVNAAIFSPDGRFVLIASDDQAAQLWELASKRLLRSYKGPRGSVSSAVFSPDGRLLLTISDHNTASLWEVDSGRLTRVLHGHEGWIRSASFSPDGRYLFTASDDKTARLWEVETGMPVNVFRGHTANVLAASYASNGRYLATASDDKSARIWHFDPANLVREFQDKESLLIAAALSADGRYLVTTREDKIARLWDVGSGRPLRKFSGHNDRVNGVAFSPDGRILATSSQDKTARLWNVADGTVLHVLSGHEDDLHGVAFSPNGRYIVTTSDDQSARLWDVASGLSMRVFTGHDSGVVGAAWSPDGRYLATASHDQTARLWDVDSGLLTRIFKGHDGWLRAVAFSPDGQLLATGSEDKTARLWDAKTGHLLAILRGHDQSVNSLAFSPNGRFLITGSDDFKARIWDVPSRRLLRVIKGHEDSVNSTAFSSDGRTLITAATGGSVRLWSASEETRSSAAIATLLRCHLTVRLQGEVVVPADPLPQLCGSDAPFTTQRAARWEDRLLPLQLGYAAWQRGDRVSAGRYFSDARELLARWEDDAALAEVTLAAALQEDGSVSPLALEEVTRFVRRAYPDVDPQAHAYSRIATVAYERLYAPAIAHWAQSEARRLLPKDAVLSAELLEMSLGLGKWQEMLREGDAVLAAQADSFTNRSVVSGLLWAAARLAADAPAQRKWAARTQAEYAQLADGTELGWVFSGTNHTLLERPLPAAERERVLELLRLLRLPKSVETTDGLRTILSAR